MRVGASQLIKLCQQECRA